jgi:hypothetical protein
LPKRVPSPEAYEDYDEQVSPERMLEEESKREIQIESIHEVKPSAKKADHSN